MTLEVLPVGQACNLGCSYCYENPMRDAGNAGGKYDVDAMIATIDRLGEDFVLFGGEPMLMRYKDLERMLKYGYSKYGKIGVQTNGTILTNRHLQLFRDTKAHIGVSIDGPGILNSARCGHSGDPAETKRLTARTLRNIKRLVDAGVGTGLIITMHKWNASRMTQFKTWLKWLDGLPIYSVRLHILENHHYPEIALTEQENIDTFLELAKFEMRELKNIRFDMFKDMLELLSGTNNNATCIWRECDPYTTNAVRGVNGDGSRSNCGRVNKDGVNWLKADETLNVRQIALFHTPQSSGGCQGCRFFLGCRGFCPGTALAGDWRNRTEHCGVIKALYTHFEQVLLDARVQPISLSPKRAKMEEDLMRADGQVQPSVGQTYHEDWTMVNGVKIHKAPVV